MTLLEVVIATALLGIGGLSLVTAMTESTAAVYAMHNTEGQARQASRFLEAVALWERSDLDQRLGEHQQGPWRLRVTRPTPTLYGLTLLDSTNGRVLLSTAIYRAVDQEASGNADAAP